MNFEIEMLPVVTWEFDSEPPNPVSAGAHAKLGFREVGQQRVAGGTKAGSLQAGPVRRQNEARTLTRPTSTRVQVCSIVTHSQWPQL